MEKILVIGANGMLGYAVSEYFKRKNYPVKALTRTEFDIAKDDIGRLETVVSEMDVVINCAGVIKPRIAEMPVEDVLTVNSLFPRNLARMCNRLDKKCFHITTDCVYTGKKGNYDENDYFDADDVYGLSKSGGDTAECMVLRTSIIGEEKGEKRSLLEWARSQTGKEINGFLNHDWNGVTTLYLAEIIEKILDESLYKKELYHIHSAQPLTKYELVSCFNDVYNLNMKINAVNAPTVINRTMKSVKDLSGKVCTKSIPQQVEEMEKFFAG
ncbi:MAG: sugar nucleotide-binding protein [Melioribacteraceae bacterium]|nr:sugar nucleotide-binding protein [Melioribacteraceae bacterium]